MVQKKCEYTCFLKTISETHNIPFEELLEIWKETVPSINVSLPQSNVFKKLLKQSSISLEPTNVVNTSNKKEDVVNKCSSITKKGTKCTYTAIINGKCKIHNSSTLHQQVSIMEKFANLKI